MDQRAGNLLPAGAYDFLDFAQVRRPFALAIPSSKCAFARGVSGLALAGLATTECSRRLAGSGTMGFAPGDGPISRLGNRAEKHAIGFLLSVVRLLFFEIGCSNPRTSGIRFALAANWRALLVAFCFVFSLLHPGDPEQAFSGHVACGSLPLYLVANRTAALA